MIDVGYVRTMAAYNAWQNRSLYRCASALSEEERWRERGAFFGSIQATLNHLLWGDSIWLSRFAGTPAPAVGIAESGRLHESWEGLCAERVALDDRLIDWAERLDPAWLEGELGWHSRAVGRELRRPKALLVAHLFNHQTHHRGQVHCLLTQAGQRPDDTDLMLLEPA